MYQRFAVTLALCTSAVACANNQPPSPPPGPPPPPDLPMESAADTSAQRRGVPRADVERAAPALEFAIEAKNGSGLTGKAELTEVDDGVKVVVDVKHIQPGLHGVHIHEVADCSAPDASSAGEHFNPEGHPHALPSDERKHLGDLGNLVAVGPDGQGRLEVVVPGATLEAGDPSSLLNRALVVHADRDTGEQPSGDSGARVGCAELTASAAEPVSQR